MFQEVRYKQLEGQQLIADDCSRPADRKPVLVLVKGYAVPYVAWVKTWSDGAFWIIPGGTPDSNAAKPFIVTHWADCLPDKKEYAQLTPQLLSEKLNAL